MFSKRQFKTSTVTVIAAGTVVEGTLKVRGSVQVDGAIDGTLVGDGAVSVGPEGRVTGELDVGSLAVGGLVEGSLLVRGHLHVLASGRVRGEARYASLEVDRGGVMDGHTGVLAPVPDHDGPANDHGVARDADAAE